MLVAKAPPSVYTEFNSLAEPIYQMRFNNLMESKKLAQIRDYLLPKLLSGQLVLKGIEASIEAVIN